MTAPLEFVAGSQPVQASVIWLHGLGADGHDFAPVVQALDLRAVRFILPHAPTRPVTINGGYVMPAWYDIRSTELSAEEDAAGLAQSSQVVDALITHEMARGVTSSRIIVGGFSQGGALALYAGLAQRRVLGGIMVLSAYLPLMNRIEDWRAADAPALSVFMAHGVEDNVVPLHLAERSREKLLACGYDVEWQVYPMAHSVCEEEIGAIRSWLIGVLQLGD